MPHPNRLYKSERLCSLNAINALFSPATAAGGNKSIIAYPWRAVWRERDDDTTTDTYRPPLRFLISVPKRKLRHAVDRVTMRRRCREAYRLNKALISPDTAADVAFIYVADRLTDYARTERSVRKIIAQICRPAAATEPETEP